MATSKTDTRPVKGSPIDVRPKDGMNLNAPGPKIGTGYKQYPGKG